jgi:hypothetical protein
VLLFLETYNILIASFEILAFLLVAVFLLFGVEEMQKTEAICKF